jgi:ribosome-associated heat shock protein Hsp15
MAKKERIDKWLWSVRIYKTRTQATKACKEGKVKLGDEKVKPSQLIEEGDVVEAKKAGIYYTLKVLKIISKRVGAPIAQECYDDLTPEDELNKFKDWYIGKGQIEKRAKGKGRPTKKERREIDAFKEDFFDFDEDL